MANIDNFINSEIDKLKAERDKLKLDKKKYLKYIENIQTKIIEINSLILEYKDALKKL